MTRNAPSLQFAPLIGTVLEFLAHVCARAPVQMATNSEPPKTETDWKFIADDGKSRFYCVNAPLLTAISGRLRRLGDRCV